MHNPVQSLKRSPNSILKRLLSFDDLLPIDTWYAWYGAHHLEIVYTAMELADGDSAGESTNASWVNTEDLGKTNV